MDRTEEEPRSGLVGFELACKNFLELFKLGSYHHRAIRIGVLVILVIFLVIIFGRVEFGSRRNFSDHRIFKSSVLVLQDSFI